MHLMVDLETVSTSPLSAIVQIGAVLFEPEEVDVLGEEFEAHVDLESCIRAGMKVDGDTIRWWMQQSPEAREAVWNKAHLEQPITQVLLQFEVFIKQSQPKGVWSHGASFDIPILECAFRRVLGRALPVPYNIVRDTRTVQWLAGNYRTSHFLTRDEGIHHSALDDAKYQARWIQRALKKVQGL